jgi:uncharacterized membrane protein
MWFIVAVLSAFLFGLAGLIMKINQMHKGSLYQLLLSLYITGAFGFLMLAYYEGSLLLGNWKLWTAGLIIGAGSAWGNLFFIKALDYGPASLTSPLVNMNIVLVIFMGTFMYNESLGWAELLGIMLLLVAVVLISFRKQETLTISQKKWFVLIGIAIVLFSFRNGGLKVTAMLGLENTPILFISYLLSAVWFVIILSIRRTKDDSAAITIASYKRGVLAGLFSFAGLQLYSTALQIGQANIVAPIFATNSLVVAFGSILLFKEHLTLLQKIAFMCLIAGLAAVRL